jgi:DNA-binding beta-propeller fold protein YncE
MILDANKNLIVVDAMGSAPTVDIIAPPYTAITRTCGSGFATPYHVALSRSNARLYVADVGNSNVQVLKYPACTSVTTLSGGTLVKPAGVTDTFNFVP